MTGIEKISENADKLAEVEAFLDLQRLSKEKDYVLSEDSAGLVLKINNPSSLNFHQRSGVELSAVKFARCHEYALSQITVNGEQYFSFV